MTKVMQAAASNSHRGILRLLDLNPPKSRSLCRGSLFAGDQRGRSLGLGSSHWLIRACYSSCSLENCLRFRTGERLRSGGTFNTAPSRRDQRQYGSRLSVRHFGDDQEIVLTEREIQVDQLAARLFAKAGNRSLAVLWFRHTALDVFARKAALCDENGHVSLLSRSDLLRHNARSYPARWRDLSPGRQP